MDLKKIKINKKYLFFLGLVFLGCFVMGDFVLAEENQLLEYGGVGLLGSALLKGANSILYGILKLTLILFAGAMWLLDVMISPEIFTTVFFSDIAKSGINTAWSFVRDFFNLFFILIIVLVGLSTILGVGKFKDKAVLLRVVVAAMLINFSKPLTLLVIDASQMFMNFFAEAIKDMQFGTQIQNLVNLKSIIIGTGWSLDDNFTFFVIIVTVIIMTLIMAIMIFYLAISLIIRMIAFWVLIILSPLAMFGFAMEGTKFGAMKTDWAEKLMSWAFYGPILLFFLWLAIILVSAISKATVAGIGGFASDSAQDLAVGAGGLAEFTVTLFGMIIPYITAIYLLFYGYEQSQKVSAGMAKKILAHGEGKINEWGKKVGHQMTFPGRREAVAGGFRERFKDTSLTKEGRKDKQALRNAKAKNSIGGDRGDTERKYYKGKAQQKVKKWEDNPPTEEKLEKMFNSDNEEEKIAATLYKSKNNKIKTGPEYGKALENLGKQKGLEEEMTRETGKENMGVIIEHEKNQKMKEYTQSGGELDGISSHSTHYKRKMKEVNMKLYEDKTGRKDNGEIFKNQQQNFYLNEQGTLKPGVLRFLHEKAQRNPDPEQRRKIASLIGDVAVVKELEKSSSGRYILGINPP